MVKMTKCLSLERERSILRQSTVNYFCTCLAHLTTDIRPSWCTMYY